MAINYHNPKSVSLSGKYSLGAEVPANARYLYVSGQVGVDSRGKLQQGFDKQAVQVWKNIGQVLKAGGMGYRDISNEIRFEIARQLLRDTQVPLGQIAAALDYSEASAFTRAFRRWAGQTPSDWRADDHHE